MLRATASPPTRSVGFSLLDDPDAAAAWGHAAGLADATLAGRVFAELAATGITFDLIASMVQKLGLILPAVSDADRVLASLGRFVASVRSPLSTATLFERDPDSLGVLLSLFSASPFLADAVITDPEAWEDVRLGRGRPESKDWLAAMLAAEMGGSDDPDVVLGALRRFRRRQTLRIAYGDIVAGNRLETVVSQISHVADCIVAAAVCTALGSVERQRGVPRGADGARATLAVFALGKLGGSELNYSSDIDLVFVYSADGRVDGPKPCTTQEFFDRVVKETVRLLSASSPHGSGYRVDLRLRPHGGAGTASIARDAMLQYYDQAGRTWERQAWVKARCIAGDEALGASVLAELEPWVYRRWLTRADISGIKALKRRMERRAIEEGIDEADVKSGRGGIRDVEFTIQFLQLLGGGDNPAVRTSNTLEAIRRLSAAGSLTDQEREILERNYTFLRIVEHRLQVLYDRQTHLVPSDPIEIGRLAVRCGEPPGPEGQKRFRAALAEATDLNRRILNHLLHDAFPDDAPPEPEVDLVLDPAPSAETIRELLGRHGFHDPMAAYRSVVGLAEERVRFLSTRRCRHFFAAVAPRLLATIARTPDPDATLATLRDVADSLGGKGVLWELFSFSPQTLDLTVKLCASSPFLARLLVTNPGMIDELLDSLLIQRLPTSEELEATLADLCEGAVQVQAILHAFKVSHQLRVGVRDVLASRGQSPPWPLSTWPTDGKAEVSHGRQAPHRAAAPQDAETTTSVLTAIAETLVRRVVAIEEERLMDKLGEPIVADGPRAGERARPLVLAMGKFGGREMNYASDIDVVFLYDHDGESRQRRRTAASTSNAHFFGELAGKTMRIFNEFSPQGRLYEMDSRLRPSGRSGPPAISLAEFARYFAPDGPAQIWERQALVKARIVVGTADARAEARRIIDAATYERRWTAADVEAIRRMRYRMEEGAKASNLKRGPGGVVDIEFIVQMLCLVHGGRNPSLRTTGTLAGLVALHAAGHMDDEPCAFLERAYRTLRAIEGRLRLLDTAGRHDFPSDPDEQRKLAHLLGYDDPESVVADVRDITFRTRAEFERIFAETEQRIGK